MGGGANNYPLRGGKTSDFEGGVRVNAWVSGGLLPPAVRGTISNDFMHLADWCECRGVVRASCAGCLTNAAAAAAAGRRNLLLLGGRGGARRSGGGGRPAGCRQQRFVATSVGARRLSAGATDAAAVAQHDHRGRLEAHRRHEHAGPGRADEHGRLDRTHLCAQAKSLGSTVPASHLPGTFAFAQIRMLRAARTAAVSLATRPSRRRSTTADRAACSRSWRTRRSGTTCASRRGLRRRRCWPRWKRRIVRCTTRRLGKRTCAAARRRRSGAASSGRG